MPSFSKTGDVSYLDNMSGGFNPSVNITNEKHKTNQKKKRNVFLSALNKLKIVQKKKEKSSLKYRFYFGAR